MKSKPVKKSGFWGYQRAHDLVAPASPGESKHEQLVFPQPVVIGPYNFDVRFMDAETAAREEQWGSTDFETQTIWLVETLTGIHFAVILLHELFHACHYIHGLDDSSSEESFTHGQANALITLMRFNPEIWDWINSYIREAQTVQQHPLPRLPATARRTASGTVKRRNSSNVIKIA